MESCDKTSANSRAPAGGGPDTRAAISAGVARRNAGIDGSLSRSTSRSTAA